MSDILSLKNQMRRVMEERRRILAARQPEAALQLRDCFLKTISLPSRGTVALYHAHKAEMNPALLAISLQEQKHNLALPVITTRGQPLIFRSYEIGDKLITGPMGILEPSPQSPQIDPDILLVPLLAFDPPGYRLGYGGGYYDRTLTELRKRKKIIAIGIAYDGQEIPDVPKEPHDVQLDKIVTETRVLDGFAP